MPTLGEMSRPYKIEDDSPFRRLQNAMKNHSDVRSKGLHNVYNRKECDRILIETQKEFADALEAVHSLNHADAVYLSAPKGEES